MSFSIQGRTAIVTGAAKGIGRSIALHLAERGANVICADSEEAAASCDLAEKAQESGQLRWFSADMSERLSMTNLVSATLDAFERVDILVNAHRLVKPSDPLSVDADQLEEMLRQNMMASLRLSQIVAKRMIKQSEEAAEDGPQSGAIVNLTTLAAQRPHPSLMGYSIACAAQDQATRSLALALAPHRIRVNGVAFGSIMSEELRCKLRDHPELRDDIIAGTPMGRIAAADELAEMVHYLVSPASAFVTGQIINVDGGRSLADPVRASVF
ncbi:MAG: SDR family oxidoreductase [Paracoccus sp. (in: a-proteobacteria)]|uniref:SDR family NAD(P)-dependent oxidoreductase n=1 Tax=Paracoccus sp. TaxID=267 RepID=UPI0026E0653A|nr:SDR family oxidoreductase [Paracoccus sp. (in: a-proteobacteria)]MDO5620593.1 SDR family oxidoreductase [Paracoccus sp. (in: a-proteobacteria)]